MMACLLLSLRATPGLCTRVVSQSGFSEQQLAPVEEKLFKRIYSYDPVDKRLQRLELLLFGYSNSGSNLERWRQIQLAINGRAKKNYQSNDQSSGGSQAAIVSAIEKQILKKSTPTEPISKRLDRLEAKVFGQASPALPTSQRVERLKRTVGLALPANPEITINPNTFDPWNNQSSMPFTFRFNGRTIPDIGGFGAQDPEISQMLKDMDKQMREMQQFGNSNRMPPNGNNREERHFFYYEWPPRNNKKHDNEEGTDGSPKPQPNIPGLRTPNFDRLPPYSDPNMI
jgi:hypothetical protein